LVLARAAWPPFGYCGTCHERTQWFEATERSKTNLICMRCGRVSPKEVKPRKDGGLYYEGFCRSCAATTPWAFLRKGITRFMRDDRLVCCNCGRSGKSGVLHQVYLAPCTICGGETLWYEEEIWDRMCCASCSRGEPLAFKRWLEMTLAQLRAEDKTQIWADR